LSGLFRMGMRAEGEEAVVAECEAIPISNGRQHRVSFRVPSSAGD
jgi:hypothetical protein